MYVHKYRNTPIEMCILAILNNRMDVPEEFKSQLNNICKGWEGEKRFDTYLEKMLDKYIMLNDLLLQMNNTTFQIDSLLISGDAIFLFEIKNYEGDFYYEKESFFTKNQQEISNPVTQLRRTESFLRQLLSTIGYRNIPVVSHVVFVNPEFTLYQAPINLPIIYPNQLNRYFNQREQNAKSIGKREIILAEKLKSLHIKDNPYSMVFDYRKEELRKGIVCKKCSGFDMNTKSSKVICNNCHYEEEFTQAVIRTVEEFQLLFPDEIITTSKMYKWCDIEGDVRRIKRVLDRHFKLVRNRRWSYYEKK